MVIFQGTYIFWGVHQVFFLGGVLSFPNPFPIRDHPSTQVKVLHGTGTIVVRHRGKAAAMTVTVLAQRVSGKERHIVTGI